MNFGVLIAVFYTALSQISGVYIDYEYTNLPGMPPYFYAYSVYYDEAAGAVYFCGWCQDSADGQTYFNDGASDAFITKHHAANGSRIWVRMLSYPNWQELKDIGPYPGTTDIIAGGTTFFALNGHTYFGDCDAVLVRYASNGTRIYQTQFGTASCEKIFDLVVVNDVIYTSGIYQNGMVLTVNSAVNGSLLRFFKSAGNEAFGIAYANTENDFLLMGATFASVKSQPTFGNSDILL